MTGYCAASGCSFQLRVDSGTGMPRRVQRLSQLLLRIEIDVLALWTTKKRSLRRLFRQHLLQLFGQFDSSLLDDAQLLEPAILVHVKAGQLDIDHRHHAFKLELRALHQRLRLQTLDQLFTQRQQDRGVARGVLQLRFGQLEVPVAQAL